jgi:hypothetical protein
MIQINIAESYSQRCVLRIPSLQRPDVRIGDESRTEPFLLSNLEAVYSYLLHLCGFRMRFGHQRYSRPFTLSLSWCCSHRPPLWSFTCSFTMPKRAPHYPLHHLLTGRHDDLKSINFLAGHLSARPACSVALDAVLDVARPVDLLAVRVSASPMVDWRLCGCATVAAAILSMLVTMLRCGWFECKF